MAEDILLLRLLTIPVFVIKFVSKVISILTYLPNYFFVLVMDSIIFNQNLQKSLSMYSLTWPFRFIALNLVTALFCFQFYSVYYLLDIYERPWYTQVLAMLLALGGMLFLMRKGYLQMIQKFKPIKLKSPIEHVEIYIQMFKDIFGVFLGLINILLIVNAFRTFSYDFLSLELNSNCSRKNAFLSHIYILIWESLLYDLTFFYLKIFFKIFKWRLQHNLQFVHKEKDHILNLMVLLTLMFWQTLLDIMVVGIFGPFCILHWKRNVFKNKVIIQQRKYRVALQHFGLIIIQLFQIVTVFPLLILNFTSTVTHLRKLIQADSGSGQTQEFTPLQHLLQTCKHILHSWAKIPVYFSLLMIFVFRYKYQKLQIILFQLKSGASPIQDWQKDKIYMQLNAEQVIDMFFLPPIAICLLSRPLNYKWLSLLISHKFDLNRQMTIKYFLKCIGQIFCWMPLGLFLTLIVVLYAPRHVFTFMNGYYIMQRNQTLIQSVQDQSVYKKYSIGLLNKLVADLPHLPLYFIMKLSFLGLFNPDLNPSKAYSSLQRMIKMFYIHRVKSSPRSQQYFQMFNKDMASGIVRDERHSMRFWKFVHKCQRHILVTKILQILVPKSRFQRKINSIQVSSNLSCISNEYWYRLQITKLMLRVVLFFIIEIILDLFGLLMLVPLTLWRLPTFILVYRVHRSQRLFFKIIYQVYQLMLFDIVMILPNLLGFLMSPISYVRFKLKTMFRYGDQGYGQLFQVQAKKAEFVLKVLIIRNWAILKQILKIGFIYVLHVRKSAYLIQLKRRQLNFSILKQSLITGVEVPEFICFTQPNYSFQSIKLGQIAEVTHCYFIRSKEDIPYLMVFVFVLVIMPWRFFYLKKALKQMKEDSAERYQMIKVMKNVFKDYLCIFINIILLMSIVKTKKAIRLIIRNYRLNFFVGFLKYSFLKQLVYELKQAFHTYYSILLILTSLVMDWQNIKLIHSRLHEYYKKSVQEQEAKRENERIYKNTIEQKKDLRILDLMGFNEYITLCQFLTVKDLSRLSRVNKINYLMLERDQTWIQKWQNNYTSKYEQQIKGQTYKLRCIKAFQFQLSNNKTYALTFNQLVREMFEYHIYQTRTNFPALIRPYLSIQAQQKIYMNYEWNVAQGYGPQNQLPRQQHQDEQFLRLTNQVRRPRLEHQTQIKLYADHLLIRPIQKISTIINNIFRVDSHRRWKQLAFIVGLVLFPITLVVFLIYNCFCTLFQVSRWIGITLLIIVYVFTFLILLYIRLQTLSTNWISLIPFNLVTDIKDAILYAIHYIRVRLLQVKRWYSEKVYTPVRAKLIQACNFVVQWLKKIINFTIEKVKYVSKIIVDKVVSPLYITCVKKLIATRKLIVMVFKATTKFAGLVFSFLKNIMVSTYQLLAITFKNVDRLYFSILLHLRKGLARFGVVGELIFTIFGLVLMTSPSILCYFAYSHRWYVIVSTVHTAILIVLGYKHLNQIKKKNQ